MNDDSIVETIKESFRDLMNDGVQFIPKILVAILLVIIGSMIASWLTKIIAKVLARVEKLPKVKESVDRLGFDVFSLSKFGLLLLRWAIALIFYSAAVDVLGLQVLTDTLNSLVDYIPKIFAAAIVMGLTLVAANVVKDIVAEAADHAGIKAYNTLSSTAKILVLVFGVPLAAAQLGLDLTIINNNITVIVAGFMLAFGLAFGLGGRETAAKIVNNAYKNFKK